jgi:protein required for attachment to host cells
MTTWVGVADSSRGRIYVQDKPGGALTESEDLLHAGSRLHAGDLVSDRQGRGGGAVGQGRHVIDARTGIKEHEIDTFAKEISDRLDTAPVAGRYQRLVLMAPPAFLGTLRANLNDKVTDLVVGEVDRNLVMHTIEDVRQHLSQVV